MLSTFFMVSTMLKDLFKRPQHLVQQSVECILKQMLKPFKRAFMHMRLLEWAATVNDDISEIFMGVVCVVVDLTITGTPPPPSLPHAPELGRLGRRDT